MNVLQAFPRRGNGAPDIPIPEIVNRLAGDIVALCERLLPNGHRDGREWRVGSVGGEPGKSMAVHLNGAKAGIWSDFADGSKGDPLDLIQACQKLDKGGAVLWAKDWLGLGDGTGIRPCAARPGPRPQTNEAQRQDNPNGTLARAIWDQSRPAAGTPVEAYLKFRGISIPAPPTLRYHVGIKHEPSGLLLPAMVAAVQAPDRSLTAINRTFLLGNGRGKAPVTKPKMMLGSVNGGCVRLSYAGPKMVIAEGIETALTVLQATGLPVWAALSASYFIGLALPELPLAGEVVIAADHDEAGIKAAEKAATHWSAQGRKVSITYPPTTGTDFNDMARDELRAQKGFAA